MRFYNCAVRRWILQIIHGSGVVGESSLSKAKWIVNSKARSGLGDRIYNTLVYGLFELSRPDRYMHLIYLIVLIASRSFKLSLFFLI
jgi:hypothetical protein